MILFLLLALAAPDSPRGFDLDMHFLQETKVLIHWEWAQGNGAVATGFKIYCGPDSNNYTETADVPDPTAREYLVGPLVANLLKYYGEPLRVHCTVAAINAIGDSIDGPVGSPDPITKVGFEFRK